MQFMTSKKKNRIEEPTEAYEATPKDEVTSQELHPVLVQMLEIGLRQIELGQTKPHEQVMAEMKKKYNFK